MRPVGGFVFEVAPKGFRADLPVHPFHQKRFGGFPQVQIGIELAAQAFDVEQRFLQQHKLRLDFDIEAAADFKQAHQHQAEGNLRNRFVEHRFAHGADGGFQFFRTRVGRHPARFDVGGGDAPVIAVEKGEEIDGEITFVVIGQRADDTEIEGDVAVVGGNQNIAGVHIRVEKAVAEDLREKDFHAVIGEFVQIDAVCFEFGDVGNRRAVHPFDCQHVAGAVVVKHLGHNQHIAVLEIAPELSGIGGFAHQIQLVVQVFVELRHHFERLQTLAVGKQTLHPNRAETHQRQILFDKGQKVGAQNFDSHSFARMQAGFVYLGDGRAGDGLGFKFRIQLFDGLTQRFFDLFTRKPRVKRRHFVLQLCQFDGVIVRNQIRACGQNLPELDENRPQAFQGKAQTDGRRFVFQFGRLRHHFQQSAYPTATHQRSAQTCQPIAVKSPDNNRQAFQPFHI
ncbi:Uncharacterised protein [Neisseria meningitidis]|nr:Uncharacterised protein [Neisseria meningitidis]